MIFSPLTAKTQCPVKISLVRAFFLFASVFAIILFALTASCDSSFARGTDTLTEDLIVFDCIHQLPSYQSHFKYKNGKTVEMKSCSVDDESIVSVYPTSNDYGIIQDDTVYSFDSEVPTGIVVFPKKFGTTYVSMTSSSGNTERVKVVVNPSYMKKKVGTFDLTLLSSGIIDRKGSTPDIFYSGEMFMEADSVFRIGKKTYKGKLIDTISHDYNKLYKGEKYRLTVKCDGKSFVKTGRFKKIKPVPVSVSYEKFKVVLNMTGLSGGEKIIYRCNGKIMTKKLSKKKYADQTLSFIGKYRRPKNGTKGTVIVKRGGKTVSRAKVRLSGGKYLSLKTDCSESEMLAAGAGYSPAFSSRKIVFGAGTKAPIKYLLLVRLMDYKKPKGPDLERKYSPATIKDPGSAIYLGMGSRIRKISGKKHFLPVEGPVYPVKPGRGTIRIKYFDKKTAKVKVVVKKSYFKNALKRIKTGITPDGEFYASSDLLYGTIKYTLKAGDGTYSGKILLGEGNASSVAKDGAPVPEVSFVSRWLPADRIPSKGSKYSVTFSMCGVKYTKTGTVK